jgi:hypothetical protein
MQEVNLLHSVKLKVLVVAITLTEDWRFNSNVIKENRVTFMLVSWYFAIGKEMMF